MSSVAEITNVFATVASYLQTLNSTSSTVREDEERSLDLAISKLNGSLNLDGEGDDPTVQLLDTALSLTCFTAPHVFDSVIERHVETIVAALSSSVSCRLLKFQHAEALQIGGLISERDCGALIEACSDVLVKLNENDVSGRHSQVLLDAVIRATFAASRYQYMFPTYPVYGANPARCSGSAALVILHHLPREFCLNKDEVPLRLLLWYLDPLVLKHDISQILRETMERPFLCLDQEFHRRTDWRMIIICLMFCPIMFLETRSLLHKWFLETGAAPVLVLSIKLVAAVLDMSSRPSWWSIPGELGMKLPFSDAYFPFNHHLYRILSGPITTTSFLDLVHFSCSNSAILSRAAKFAMIDHKSAWALAIAFPTWFCYASMSLFYGQAFEHISQNIERTQNMEPLPSSTTAATYISWILDPIDETQQKHLADFLIKSSESWICQQSASGGTDQETAVSRKKLKKPKFCNNIKTASLRGDLQSTVSWLENFENALETFSCPNSAPRQHRSVMFQSIPLGILVGWPGDIGGGRCELLLYYAATGRIFQLKETRFVGPKDLKKDSPGIQESASWIDECNTEDVVAGASLVFRLTDIVESMSGSLFETEESAVNFVCKFKGRAYSFLVKCIKRLMIKLDISDDGPTVISDLCSRLLQWKNQGLVSDGKDLDDIIARLNWKISAT